MNTDNTATQSQVTGNKFQNPEYEAKIAALQEQFDTLANEAYA